MNFLSTQWSSDGSTSSEPMGLCITSIVKTLTDNHTLDDRNHQGRHTTLLLSDFVVHSPSKSVRRWSQELGINRESVRIILIADLHMYPYRIQIKQKLTPGDTRKRVITCQWFCDKIDAVPEFLDNVWFSVEAHLLLSGHVNSKNNIFWGSTPPEHCLQKPLHTVKCIPGYPSPNMGSLDHSGSRTTTSGLWQSTPSDMSRCLASSGQHLVDGEGSSGSSSRMVPPPTPQTNHWHGYSSVFLTDWSAVGVTRSGRRIHWTWFPRFLSVGYLKDRVYGNNPQTITDLKANGGMREGHRELCPRAYARGRLGLTPPPLCLQFYKIFIAYAKEIECFRTFSFLICRQNANIT